MTTLRRYYVLRTVGSLANQFLQFLLPVIIYSATGSVLWTGIAFIVEWGPRLLSLLVAGAMIDRFGIRVVYVSSDLLRLAVAATACVVMAIDHGAVRWCLLAIAVVSGACFEQSFIAGEKAVRVLAPLATMHRSQSILGAIDQATLVLAPAFGAAVLVAGPLPSTLCVTVAFAVDLVLALRLPAQAPAEEDTSILQSVAEGVRTVTRSPVLRDVVALTMLVNLMMGVILSGAPVLVSRAHHSGSYLGLVYAVGGVASIAVLSSVGKVISRLGLLGLGVLTQLAVCATYALAGASSQAFVFAAVMAVFLSAESMFTVFIRTVRAHVVPPESFARVVGVIVLLNFAPMPLAGVIVGASAWIGSLAVVIAVTGALCAAASVALLIHLATRPLPAGWPHGTRQAFARTGPSPKLRAQRIRR